MTDIKRKYTVGADPKYTENYNKIKWEQDVEIKEFAEKQKITKCCACGANVKVAGNTTMYYENLDLKRIDELEKLIKSYCCCSHVENFSCQSCIDLEALNKEQE